MRVLTKGFYTLEEYRHSLEKSGYADFFLFLGQFNCSDKVPMNENADYIVMKKDGTVWVVETKGGESKGQDKNIDRQIENKFNAFKAYAAQHGLHWGFVRDKDNSLYINNTEFAIDMADEHWQDIATVF